MVNFNFDINRFGVGGWREGQLKPNPKQQVQRNKHGLKPSRGSSKELPSVYMFAWRSLWGSFFNSRSGSIRGMQGRSGMIVRPIGWAIHFTCHLSSQLLDWALKDVVDYRHIFPHVPLFLLTDLVVIQYGSHDNSTCVLDPNYNPQSTNHGKIHISSTQNLNNYFTRDNRIKNGEKEVKVVLWRNWIRNWKR